MNKTEKLEKLLKDNADKSDIMCRYYCGLILKTHIFYNIKNVLRNTLNNFRIDSEYFVVTNFNF